MSEDIVKRLRESAADEPTVSGAKLLSNAADRIEALERAQAWRPIETAPKDGTPVLVAVHRDDRRLVGEAYFYVDQDDLDRGAWWWANEHPGDYHADNIDMRWTITHWMPLPTPPEAK